MLVAACASSAITKARHYNSDKCIYTHAFYDTVPQYYMQSASVLNKLYATVDIVLVGILQPLTKNLKSTSQENELHGQIQLVFLQQ